MTNGDQEVALQANQRTDRSFLLLKRKLSVGLGTGTGEVSCLKLFKCGRRAYLVVDQLELLLVVLRLDNLIDQHTALRLHVLARAYCGSNGSIAVLNEHVQSKTVSLPFVLTRLLWFKGWVICLVLIVESFLEMAWMSRD